MKKKLLYLLTILFLMVPIMINASSGALKKATIKKCPDGVYYGRHGDGHWHAATYKNGTYYADGDSFTGDPCPKVRVTFYPRKGTVSPRTKYVYGSFKYGKLPTPKRRGYTFLGWYTSTDWKTKIVSSSIVKTKYKSLYAKWGRTKYKITYDLKGGTNNSANPSTYRITDKVTLKNPKRTGYIFKGWYKDSKLKNKVTYIAKGSVGNKKFYSKWAAITYKLEYKSNGGTGKMTATTGLKYNKTYTLKANAFKRTGYTFAGWNKKADGTSTNYANKANFKNLTAKNNGTAYLYAQWNAINYTITYNLNEGINNELNPETYTIKDSVTLSNPTRDGYVFLGWYSDSEFKNKVNTIKVGTIGNKTFYAKWEVAPNNIIYHLDGGVNNPLNVNTFKVDESVTLNNPTKRGYTFLGWYTDSEFQNEITEISMGTTTDIELYAKWSIINYTITYHLNDGVNNENNVNSYTVNDEVELFNPTKEGFSFYGWYSDSEFENEVEAIEEGTTIDIDLYAKWGDIRYEINYHLDGGNNSQDNVGFFVATDEVTLYDATKLGYTFHGWYSDSEFNNKITKIESGTTHDVEVYAKWEIITYNITYYFVETNNPLNVSTYTVEDIITLYPVEKDGYTFLGWTRDTGNVQIITEIPKGTTGNIQLYAQWTPLTYNITYVMNGGTNSANNQSTFNPNSSVFLHTPTREGFLFGGWYFDPEFTQRTDEIPLGTSHDVTVYAKWNSADSYEDAIARALEYLSERAYSRDYLLMALEEWETFTHEAALYAVDNLNVDWNSQAATRMEEICNTTSYSLVKAKEALIQWDLFTEEQAEYAGVHSNVNFNEQAQRYAYNAVQLHEYTRSELIAEMLDYGFTEEQANIGADWVEL